MNKLLLISLLFGACLSVHANAPGEPAGPKAEGGGGAGANAGLDVKVGVDAGGAVNAVGDVAGGVEAGVGDVGKGAGELVGGVLSDVSKGLSSVGAGLIAGAKGGAGGIQAIIDFIKWLVEALMGFVLNLLNAITEQIEKAEDQLFKNAGIAKIGGGFGSIIQQLRSQLRGLGEGVIGGIRTVGSGLINTVSGKDFDGSSFTPNVEVGASIGAGAGGHHGGHHHGGGTPGAHGHGRPPAHATSAAEGGPKPKEE